MKQKSLFSKNNIKKIDEFESLLKTLSNKETKEDLEERLKCENDFTYFLQKAWKWFDGNDNFQLSWHIRVICEHLEECYKKNIKYLIINVPPRTSKSSICAVAFPAWVWCKSPEIRFLYSSYAQKLSVKHSTDCRNLILSPWYQKYWGNKVHLSNDDNSKLFFSNTKRGYRMSSSVGGTNTGFGGDFIICDDPNSAHDVESDLIRNNTNEWWSGVMSSRYNNIKTCVRIIIQQRLHEKDLTGYMLSQKRKDIVHLCLPMQYEPETSKPTVSIKSTFPNIWKDPRTKRGELLCPERINKDQLVNLYKELASEYRIAGQYQQRPSPSEGGIIKRHWFKPFDEINAVNSQFPKFEFILQSWDTALSAEINACYSACVTLGIYKDKKGINNIFLLNAWSGQVEYPELRKLAQRMFNNCYDTNLNDDPWDGIKSDLVLVEAKANGLSLIQDLNKAGLNTMQFNPTKYGDKLSRARIASSIIECGKLHLPFKNNTNKFYKYGEKLINACATFPNNESNDLVDALTQAIIYLQKRNFINNSNNPNNYFIENEDLSITL